ncbi:MAG TPA: PrsW family glutamic-type intramembrane protease [Vicinamibacteria bacterium]
MSLYIAVCFSAVLAALVVYRYDLYNREPWYLIALAAGLGFGTMRILATIELWALGFVEAPVGQAAVAAVLEEAARLAAVVSIALVLPRWFDDPMDGIIYGSIVGLGMSVEESLVFLQAGRAADLLLFPLELVRLLGHLVMGGIAGFGVGMARMKTAGWRRALVLSFSAAIALHFAWDWVSLAAPDGKTLPAGLHVLAAAILLAGIGIYGGLVVFGSRLSRAAFAPGSVRSLWGFPFKSR